MALTNQLHQVPVSQSANGYENPFNAIVRSLLKSRGGEYGKHYCLREYQDPRFDRMPYTMRVLLESAIRNCDNRDTKPEDVETILAWKETSGKIEIPFKPSRVWLQDVTGVSIVAGLASMRDAMENLGGDSNKISPLVPVDLGIGHIVEDGVLEAKELLKYDRQLDRDSILQWAVKAFHKMRVVRGFNQVNLELLARDVFNSDGYLHLNSIVGTCSETSMLNALGVVGWNVGGLDAIAAMLGQPISMILPSVIGCKLTSKLPEEVTITDLGLNLTQKLKNLRMNDFDPLIVEFYGEGVNELSVPDRATIAHMSPVYGAIMGFFPMDQRTLDYLRSTGCKDVDIMERYIRENNMFVDHNNPERICYSEVITVELNNIKPSLSGPSRHHDQGSLKSMKDSQCGVDKQTKDTIVELNGRAVKLTDDRIVIAAIKSCTSPSHPRDMLLAGILAKKAVQKGLKVQPWVKTSLVPGSEVITKYLQQSGLKECLKELGFNIVENGSTDSGDLDENIKTAIKDGGLNPVAVFCGNQNFERCVHPLVQKNYLGSPLTVVLFALVGTFLIHHVTSVSHIKFKLGKDRIGVDNAGNDVFFNDLWPTVKEIDDLESRFQHEKITIPEETSKWNHGSVSKQYTWDKESTEVKVRPYLKDMKKDLPKIICVRGCVLKVVNTTNTISDTAATICLAQSNFGYGNSIDWAELLASRGVKAVIAKSFERITLSNLVRLGIIPLCYKPGEDSDTLNLTGCEKCIILFTRDPTPKRPRRSIKLPKQFDKIRPLQDAHVTTNTGKSFMCTVRFDTQMELEYFKHGGILQYVIRQQLQEDDVV